MDNNVVDRRELISPPARVFVAGHRGLVGTAVASQLRQSGFEVLTADRNDLDLRESAATLRHLTAISADAVVIAAAKVGGIIANERYPVDFLEENLLVQMSVIRAAHAAGCARVLVLGSSCIYPREAPQPITESSLLTGPLEPTNEAYAIAKIAGIAQVKAYRKQYGRSFTAAMPTNLYGITDNYDLETSHVIPALIRRLDTAKTDEVAEVHLQGTGAALREFLHVTDLAAACEIILRYYDDSELINVGSGDEVSIAELANIIAETVGFHGRIVFDRTGKDGTPRKLLESSRIRALGWHPAIELRDGIRSAYSAWVEAGRPDRMRSSPETRRFPQNKTAPDTANLLLPLVAIFGAPGVGKTTTTEAVIAESGFVDRVPIVTTRPPRNPSEETSGQFHYVSNSAYLEMLKSGALAASFASHGHHLYGVSSADLENIRPGRIGIVDIHPAALAQLRVTRRIISVMILPPTAAELARRLATRAPTNDGQALDVRWRSGERILSSAETIDYFVVNDDLDTAVREIVAVARVVALEAAAESRRAMMVNVTQSMRDIRPSDLSSPRSLIVYAEESRLE
jgi:GDP-L-fucose synthase